MRVSPIEINGRTYPICASPRVMSVLEERGLTMEGVFADQGHQITNLFLLLSLMLDAGHRWAQRSGEEAEEPPTMDELMDTVDYSDLGAIVEAVGKALPGGAERHVEAKPAKKKDGSRPPRPPQG